MRSEGRGRASHDAAAAAAVADAAFASLDPVRVRQGDEARFFAEQLDALGATVEQARERDAQCPPGCDWLPPPSLAAVRLRAHALRRVLLARCAALHDSGVVPDAAGRALVLRYERLCARCGELLDAALEAEEAGGPLMSPLRPESCVTAEG